MSDIVHPAQLLFTDKHPLTAALGMTFSAPKDKVMTITLAAPLSFADKDKEHCHTGFSTLILDTLMGSCVIGELSEAKPLATVKLTVNHIERAKLGEELLCRAHYDGEKDEIAFVSGEILAGPEKRLIANGIGTFMIGTANKSIREKT